MTAATAARSILLPVPAGDENELDAAATGFHGVALQVMQTEAGSFKSGGSTALQNWQSDNATTFRNLYEKTNKNFADVGAALITAQQALKTYASQLRDAKRRIGQINTQLAADRAKLNALAGHHTQGSKARSQAYAEARSLYKDEERLQNLGAQILSNLNNEAKKCAATCQQAESQMKAANPDTPAASELLRGLQAGVATFQGGTVRALPGNTNGDTQQAATTFYTAALPTKTYSGSQQSVAGLTPAATALNAEEQQSSTAIAAATAGGGRSVGGGIGAGAGAGSAGVGGYVAGGYGPGPLAGGTPAPSAQVKGWMDQAIKELVRDGVLPKSALDPNSAYGKKIRAEIGIIIAHESGGNPDAINEQDSNAKVLHDPSRGLMQTIGATFVANAPAGQNSVNNIYNPVANIYAGVKYALKTYPSPSPDDPLGGVPGVAAVESGAAYKPY